jgi:hypothetical protein
MIVLLTVAVTAAFWLGSRSADAWRRQRAGAVYELPMDHRTAVLWGAAALIAGLFALAAVLQPGPHARQRPTAAEPLRLVSRSSPRPSSRPGPAAPSPSAPGSGAPMPTAASATPTGATLPFRPAGPAAGGTWWDGVVQGDPARVWTPPGYGTDARSYPVLVAQSAEVTDLAAAVAASHARPFVVLDPGQGVDGPALRGAVTAAFRVSPDPRAWGVLGVGPAAANAVQAALAAPDRYAAGVGIDGRYEEVVPVARPGARVLLATSRRDAAAVASAERLRTALGTRARLRVWAAPDRLPARARLREFRDAVAYLDTALDAPNAPSRATVSPPPPTRPHR